MGFDPLDRREFFAGAGGLFLCTLAGQRVLADRPADVEKLAAEVPVPPRVAAANAEGAGAASASTLVAARGGGPVREYWIRAEQAKWDIVPSGKDSMMNEKVKGKTKFTAYVYRAYSPGFEAPLGPAQIPGPLIEATVGETVVVNFQNALSSPVTVHPHGIFYAEEMDGAYKGKYTPPGGFVERNRTFQYVWDAVPGTEGAWLYHDHGPIEPLTIYKGLFGPLIIRKPGDPVPNREFAVFFHNLDPAATGLRKAFSCVNGRAHAGNAPTFRASVGESVAWYVYGIDNNFHTFHVHGHRWQDSGGRVVDNQTVGPGDSMVASYVEDNPGRWLYHCHVFSHLHMGMNGWYIVE